MSQPAPPYYPTPQKKKSSNTCLIVLLILGVIVLGGVGMATLGFYLFATSKTGKDVIDIVGKGAKAVGETAKVMEEAARAPGTPELRAAGCTQAFVIDMDKLAKAFDQFDAGIPAPTDGGARVKLMVLCQVNALGSPPACDDAARAYVGAVGRAAGDFAVTVSIERDKRPRCSSRYAPDAAPLGTFHGKAPSVPSGAGAP